MKMPVIHRNVLVVAVAAAVAAASLPAAATEWQWDITPYLWLPDVGVDVAVNGEQAFDTTIDEQDVVSKLDFALQLDIQGRRGKHGILLDLNYADFNDDEKRRPLGGPLEDELVTKGDFEQTVIDAAGLWNPSGDGAGFTLIYGARIVDVDQEIDARIETAAGPTDEVRFSVSGTLVDALLGVRYNARLGEQWLVIARADASSGQSEYTWSAMAAVGYTFGANGQYTVLAGYRHLLIELQEDDVNFEVETQTSMSGFFAGLRIGL